MTGELRAAQDAGLGGGGGQHLELTWEKMSNAENVLLLCSSHSPWNQTLLPSSPEKTVKNAAAVPAFPLSKEHSRWLKIKRLKLSKFIIQTKNTKSVQIPLARGQLKTKAVKQTRRKFKCSGNEIWREKKNQARIRREGRKKMDLLREVFHWCQN